ncbi:methionine aminopeptidase [Mycena sp. CBHHK59/15]|nr:methionine aminopeptidase [Mycena sp. CBHHK59/15]
MASCQNSECPNGNPPSRLECPTCNKLGIRGSFFCGQECFKSGCESAALVHNLVNQDIASSADGTYNPFPNYAYTGSMRPVYPISPKRTIPSHIPLPDHAGDGVPKEEVRSAGQPPRILNAEEQEKMRTVCRLTREVLDIAAAHVRPGITTDELDEIVHNATIERNAYPSPLNYRNFPKSFCTSVNEVICHGIPDQRKLKESDIINLDVSLYFEGYHGDVNATYPAIEACKPGALFRDLGKIIEPIARSNGCSSVRHTPDMGSILFSTVRRMCRITPRYRYGLAYGSESDALEESSGGTMKPGMVFTIEPMINLGSNWGDVHWPDNWTATTVDGKRSAQFEETLLITETGVEILTAGAKQDL